MVAGSSARQGGQWGRIFEALADQHRRRVLTALLHHDPETGGGLGPGVAVDAELEDPERVRVQLAHTHLPKLEEMAFVEWEREDDAIRRGTEWEDIAPVLRLIEEHREELPDGWV